MDYATIIGFLMGNILIFIVMKIAGNLLMFWDITSILIVLGGSFSATMIRWPLDKFIAGFKIGVKAIFTQAKDPKQLISDIVDLADRARKESVLALEKVSIENKSLAKAIKYLVDGYDPSIINKILDIEIAHLITRHKDGRAIFEDMGEASPAFGMIGTIIGLIVIMANLADASKIGPGLAVALITTLYGALAANMFFVPFSKKLRFRSQEEVFNLRIIKEGVNSIIEGQNPRSVREKLESFLGGHS